eukprot:TRINITY_DN2203_c0_g1_i4.p1 TRINITY_DN2203_c0_g1~~TRINITY_DN2203_c0_g1_i4.p1  ORF type:complete len:430 (+),score=44.20 TRINITY_DN2203_c0_g1_i4:169-1458(+)
MVPSRSIILVVLAHLTHLSGIAAAISTELSPVCELLVVPYGYPCEDHHVTTDDGFTLLLNRIRYGRSQGGDRGGYVRPAILLQHGLMVGSESWLLSGPGEALGFVLADAGFDVWLGNARGSRWNLDHVTLAKTDKAYWDWTFEEMAEFDLPAMLETVCENTGQPRVLVAAHSQGTLMVLTSLATLASSARQRISAALLLCPIAFLGHVASRPCKAAAEIFLDKVVGKIGFKEFNFNRAQLLRERDCCEGLPGVDPLAHVRAQPRPSGTIDPQRQVAALRLRPLGQLPSLRPPHPARIPRRLDAVDCPACLCGWLEGHPFGCKRRIASVRCHGGVAQGSLGHGGLRASGLHIWRVGEGRFLRAACAAVSASTFQLVPGSDGEKGEGGRSNAGSSAFISQQDDVCQSAWMEKAVHSAASPPISPSIYEKNK